jgi:hypothetical protein
VEARHLPARHGEIDLQLVGQLTDARGAEPIKRSKRHDPAGDSLEGSSPS